MITWRWDSNPELDLRNSDPKIHFWVNFGQKSQTSPFCLKIGAPVILEELIPILGLDFQNSDLKLLFGQIWAKKTKIVFFAWKLAHMVSW